MRSVHVLRKPLVQSTVVDQVISTGTGSLNIDGTRTKCVLGDEVSLHGRKPKENGWDARWSNAQVAGQTSGQTIGRWPANLVLSDHADVIAAFPSNVKGGSWCRTEGARHFNNDGAATNYVKSGSDSSVGSASRFFKIFTAKE